MASADNNLGWISTKPLRLPDAGLHRRMVISRRLVGSAIGSFMTGVGLLAVMTRINPRHHDLAQATSVALVLCLPAVLLLTALFANSPTHHARRLSIGTAAIGFTVLPIGLGTTVVGAPEVSLAASSGLLTLACLMSSRAKASARAVLAVGAAVILAIIATGLALQALSPMSSGPPLIATPGVSILGIPTVSAIVVIAGLRRLLGSPAASVNRM